MIIRRSFSVLFAMAILASLANASGRYGGETLQEDKKKDAKPADNPEPDVPYWPTPPKVVDKMLELADVKKGDVVYDLGCGDARILVTAAKRFGVKGFGFDIDPKQVQDSLDNVKKNKLEDLVTIKKADIFALDLKDANVVTLYLLTSSNARLRPNLEKYLRPTARVVSLDFGIPGWKADRTESVHADRQTHTIYVYEMASRHPANKK